MGPGQKNLGRWGLRSHRYITSRSEPELNAVEVQIFGVRKSADTRAALRFFAERRVKVHFVDLAERAATKGELTRFVQKHGLPALVDRESRRVAELGLGAAGASAQGGGGAPVGAEARAPRAGGPRAAAFRRAGPGRGPLLRRAVARD